MHEYIDNLTQALRLTPYQSDVLKQNCNKYNMGRLVKRGGVLYAPYLLHGVYAWVVKIVCGAPADLIGQNEMLVRNNRNITFCHDGYHCVKMGTYKYYADANGHAISRECFMRCTKQLKPRL